jgi:hypothetical protein
MICIANLYYCVNVYFTLSYFYIFVCFMMFHILLSCNSLRDPCSKKISFDGLILYTWWILSLDFYERSWYSYVIFNIYIIFGTFIHIRGSHLYYYLQWIVVFVLRLHCQRNYIWRNDWGIVISLWTKKISRIFCICRSQMYIGYNHMSILYWHCNMFNILWVVLIMYGFTECIINEWMECILYCTVLYCIVNLTNSRQ